jgi:drug/metabolite transporter (DMT)-like permease
MEPAASRGMKTGARLQVKTYLLILVMVIFGPLGNVLLGKGMKVVASLGAWQAGDVAGIFERTFSSGTIWLGIASLITFFVANLLVLTWADYSFVQPASSIAYAVVALLGRYVLHEVVTPMRWAGVAVICLGVLVISRTPARTTEEAP